MHDGRLAVNRADAVAGSTPAAPIVAVVQLVERRAVDAVTRVQIPSATSFAR